VSTSPGWSRTDKDIAGIVLIICEIFDIVGVVQCVIERCDLCSTYCIGHRFVGVVFYI